MCVGPFPQARKTYHCLSPYKEYILTRRQFDTEPFNKIKVDYPLVTMTNLAMDF